jgi:transglutaminase-like putative cysteine protease
MEASIMRKVLVWIIDRVGARTLIKLILLATLLTSLSAGLAEVVWGIEIQLLLPMALLAMALGWLLARMRWRAWVAWSVILAVGFVLIFIRVGQLSGAILTVFSATRNFLIEVLLWRWNGPPDWELFLRSAAILGNDMHVVSTRITEWAIAFLRGGPDYDLVAAAFVWSSIIWLTSAWAAWLLRLYAKLIESVVPAGFVLAVAIYFDNRETLYLLLFIALTLLLQVFVSHDTRETRWLREKVDFASDLIPELSMTGAGLSLLLVMLSMALPSISIKEIVDRIRQQTEPYSSKTEQFVGSFGIETNPDRGYFTGSLYGGMPRSHLIGSGPDLDENLVLVVDVGRVYAEGQVESEIAPPQFYWRSLTYEFYNGRGWESAESQVVEYNKDAVVATLTPPGHYLYRQDFRYVQERGDLLHVAGTLVTADHDFSVAWRQLPESEPDFEPAGVAIPGDIFGASIDAEIYQVHSLLPIVSESQLRSASEQIPQSVRERYLGLPDQLPNRVLGLARDLTATEPTAYDQVKAIETYLRSFPYNLDLPIPPSDQDIVDYFLFDLQEGYCDYYATAMVVLVRAVGIPARMVMGYASGDYIEAENQYLVTEADAHSWVEVFFPGYGWIEFEPTAGLPALNRPGESPALEGYLDTNPLVEIFGDRQAFDVIAGWTNWTRFFAFLVASVLVTVLGLITIIIIDGRRLKKLPARVALQTIFGRLWRFGRRFAVETLPGDTPYEFKEALTERLDLLTKKSSEPEVEVNRLSAINWITNAYVNTTYSNHQPDDEDRRKALKLWNWLDHRLWTAWIIYKISRREKKIKEKNQ